MELDAAALVTDEAVPPGDATSGRDDFSAFFGRHHGPVFRALALTLRDPDLATDATAEAMTRAYARWGAVSRYDNAPGWVYRVGLRWALDRQRRQEREPAIAAPEGASTDTGADPALAAALARLPVDQRAVVVLRYLLDWSERETAQALGVAPGTVKSRLSRALDRLARDLEDR